MTSASDRTADPDRPALNVDRAPLIVSLLSLAFGFLMILAVARNNWFFFDEWEIIVNRGLAGDATRGLFEPHNEHWSTGPILIYRALYALFELRTYLPYLLVVILLHLLVVHLLWRLMVAIHVGGWVATLVTLPFLLFGLPANQTYLWAFQIGWVGSVAFGLLATVLVLPGGRSFAWRDGFAVASLAVALMFSGNGIVMLLLVGGVALVVRGWRVATAVTVPAGLVYAIWYLTAGSEADVDVLSRSELLSLPTFAWRGLTGSVGALVGFGSGEIWFVLLVGLFAVAAVGATRSSVALICLLAAVAYFLLVGFGRAGLGVEQAAAGRYTYVGAALLLPGIGVALTWLVEQYRWAWPLVAALTAAAVAVNTGTLLLFGERLRDQEVGSRATILAAAQLLREDAQLVDDRPEPVWAPDLDVATLERLVVEEALPSADVDDDARRAAIANLQVAIDPAEGSGAIDQAELVFVKAIQVEPLDTGCVLLRPLGEAPQLGVAFAEPGVLRLTPYWSGDLPLWVAEEGTDPATASSRSVVLAAGAPVDLRVSRSSLSVILGLPESGATEICGLLIR